MLREKRETEEGSEKAPGFYKNAAVSPLVRRYVAQPDDPQTQSQLRHEAEG